MHSSRMRTTHTLLYGGLPDRDLPGQRPPWTETPLDRDPWAEIPLDRDPPGQRPPREQNDTQV